MLETAVDSKGFAALHETGVYLEIVSGSDWDPEVRDTMMVELSAPSYGCQATTIVVKETAVNSLDFRTRMYLGSGDADPIAPSMNSVFRVRVKRWPMIAGQELPVFLASGKKVTEGTVKGTARGEAESDDPFAGVPEDEAGSAPDLGDFPEFEGVDEVVPAPAVRSPSDKEQAEKPGTWTTQPGGRTDFGHGFTVWTTHRYTHKLPFGSSVTGTYTTAVRFFWKPTVGTVVIGIAFDDDYKRSAVAWGREWAEILRDYMGFNVLFDESMEELELREILGRNDATEFLDGLMINAHAFGSDGRENFAGFVLLPDPDNDNPSDDRDGYFRGDNYSALQGIRTDTRSFDLRIVLVESCFSNRLLYRSKDHKTKQNLAPDNFRRYFGAWAYIGLTGYGYSEHDRRAYALLEKLDADEAMPDALDYANNLWLPLWPISFCVAKASCAYFDEGRNNSYPLFWATHPDGYTEGSVRWDQNPEDTPWVNR
jgi:hypothetical protein